MIKQLSFAILLFAFSTLVKSNDVREQSLEQRIKESDLVIVATAIPTKRTERSGASTELAAFKVETTVKGQAPSTVEVWVRTGIAEFSLNCCKPGHRYLLFLEKDGQGHYGSVNGPHGAYELP